MKVLAILVAIFAIALGRSIEGRVISVPNCGQPLRIYSFALDAVIQEWELELGAPHASSDGYSRLNRASENGAVNKALFKMLIDN